MYKVQYTTLRNAVQVQYSGYPYVPVVLRTGRDLHTHWMDRSRLIGLMVNYKDYVSTEIKWRNKLKMRAKLGLRNKRQVSVGCKSDTSSNRGNWNNFRIIQKMSWTALGKHDIKALQETFIWALCMYFVK
jgi:hypothetical protein